MEGCSYEIHPAIQMYYCIPMAIVTLMVAMLELEQRRRLKS